MAAGEIRGLLGMCNNPFVSLPNQPVVRAGYDALEFHVQSDFFLSETAARADVVLPSTVWAEDEGLMTNGEGRVIKHNKAVEPPGEARTDWEILCELARRLGSGDKFPFRSPAGILDELRVASKGGVADYYGITYEKVDQQNGVFWPCPSEDSPGTPRLYEESFGFEDGRARFHPITYLPPAEEPDDEYPLVLTTGRVIYHYLSGNQTRRTPFLREQAPYPWVEIHQRTAEGLGVRDGEWVTVRTRRGELTAPSLVVKSIRPDTVFIPYHYGHEQAVNILTNPVLEPMNKIPEYKVCAASVVKAAELPDWAKEVDPAMLRAARGRRRRLPSTGEAQGPGMSR
jgi:assimilatory nitrate reductase catalytic subunit